MRIIYKKLFIFIKKLFLKIKPMATKENILNELREIIGQVVDAHIKQTLTEGTIYLDPKDVPQGIKDWVRSYSGKNIQKYRVHQGQSVVTIDMPWHQADKETYQFFKLINDNAEIAGNEVTRKGWESDSPQGHIEGVGKNGKVTVPEGFVLVCYGTYPERVEIYTGENVQMFLPNKQASEDLSYTELVILAAAHGLKSFARPKFKDEWYDKLIEKGLLKKNRSITISGENVLQDPDAKEKIKKAKEIYQTKTGRYLSI